MARETPSQTIGPFFHEALIRPGENILAGDDTAGARIVVEGRITDGDGAPVGDALVELWQANAAGRYAHATDARAEVPLDAAFTGYGRGRTDGDGVFRFETIKPGPVPGPGNSLQAPHLNLVIFARGLLNHLTTRLYFEDEAANETDPVLNLVDEARRGTLIAQRRERGGQTVYRLDIRLQGAGETVFLEA